MKSLAPLALVLVLATCVGMAAAAAPPKALMCKAGAKRAVIGGRAQCLRIGLNCNVRFNSGKPSYARYGFFCTSRTTDDPTTLFRVAQPGLAPSACPGLGVPPPESTAPGFRAIGTSPFYAGPYLDLDPSATIWRYPNQPGLLGADGWSVKFLWYVADEAVPARISITDLGTGRRLAIVVHGEARSREPVLESSTAFSYPHGNWGSYVVFPHAGCYRLDAHWQPEGSWSLVFSFGR
jgi:hypothetical protein